MICALPVIAGARTIDLSTHGMNLSAMVGMLGQLLSSDSLTALKEFGAVEHALPARGSDRFSVVEDRLIRVACEPGRGGRSVKNRRSQR